MTARTEAISEVQHTAEPLTPATVGFGTALHAQVLLLHRIGRTRLLVAAAVLAVLVSIAAEWLFAQYSIEYGGFVLLSLHGWIALIAAAWGIAVWWQEAPGRRDHVRAAPVDVAVHELARITAGAVWLSGLLALTTAAALAVQLAGGRIDALNDVASSAWVALFSGPLLAYALTSAISTGTRRSIELAVLAVVVLGGVFLLSFRSALTNAMRDGDPAEAFELFRYSLFNAVTGLGNTTTTHTSQISEGQRSTETVVVYGTDMVPYWLEASLLWWAIAVIVVVFVLWRRRSA